MSKIQFIKTSAEDQSSVAFEMSGDSTYDQVIETFECFLRGCGYVFDGHIEMIEDEVKQD